MSRNKKQGLFSGNTKKARYIILTALFLFAVYALPKLFPSLSEYFGIYEKIDLEIPDGEMSVHYIDVGQGDAELIIMPSGETMLIDAGTPKSKTFLLEYLEHYKVDVIDYFILTHPHSDHIGGASAVFEDKEVKNVIMPDAVTDTQTYKKLLTNIEKEGCGITVAENGRQYRHGRSVFTVLGPVKDYGDDLNNQSVVIRLEYGERSFLFTGDAEAVAEADMMNIFYDNEFRSDVLKLGHHGSSTSTSKDFFKAVMPKLCIISCGENNDYGHPHVETIRLLEESGVKYFRTDTSESIVLSTDGYAIKVLSPANSGFQLDAISSETVTN